MAEIQKITAGGSQFYPETVSNAVIHSGLEVPITELISEYNVSVLYPTSGTEGNKYTPEAAITLLDSKLTAAMKIVGIKVSFISTEDKPSEYVFIGGTFTDINSWKMTSTESTPGGGSVDSVNGQTGEVVIGASDVGAYTVEEVDATLALKADSDNVYTKSETDTALASKANSANVYTKAETDAALTLKANSDNVYTKSEIDTALSGKASTTTTDALDTRITANEGDITALEASVGSKADSSVVEALNTRVGTVETSLSSKVDSSVVDALDIRVTANEGDITTLESSIESKLSSLGVDNSLTKSGTDTAPIISLKLDKTATTGNVVLEVTSEGLKAVYTSSEKTIVVNKGSLPAEGDPQVIYLERTDDPEKFEQWKWVEVDGTYQYVSFGLTGGIDLSNYPTNEELTAALVLKADISNVYTKSEIDTALSGKANTGVSYTKVESDAALALKANSSNVYTKTESDAALALKADTTNVYTKSETDTALSGKANSTNVYTKAESDAALALKVNSDNVYTKSEIDTALESKASTTVTNAFNIRITANEGDITALETAVGAKANSSDVYTKSETDTALASKANTTTTDSLDTRITANEGDITALETAVGAKANSDNVYTKSEIDTALSGKASTTITDGLDTRINVVETKLETVEEGAQVNVQPDWNATEGDGEILNKPVIPSITGLATEEYVDTEVATKQDLLVSGTNLKTINNESILGEGNLAVGDVFIGEKVKEVNAIIYK